MTRLKLVLCVFVWLAPRLGVSEEPFRAAADRPVDVLHSKLELEVFLKEKRIRATETIDFVALRSLGSLKLDAVDHEVFAVREGGAEGKTGQKVACENTGEKLIITFSEPIPKGRKQRIVIEYQVREPKTGLHFFGPSKTEPHVPLMVWSHGEATYNRYWFPCLDHPHERQTTELIATVDTGFEVLSNGRLVSRQTSADGRKLRFHWKQEKSHVAYLVTLVVGKFAVGREEWRGIPVLYYVPPARKADIGRTFGRTREMLEFFSRRFGIDYPWEKYAQVVVEQFVAGGMENTSATTLYEGVLHDERSLLDGTPDWLIAHELGHQWWGDLLTCKEWSHLWLNEGLATFCEVLWAEHKLGREEHDYRLHQKSRSARSGTAKTRPIVDRRYPHPGSMFDARAYPKGCWVLHMLRRQLGDDDFFGALERYGKTHAYRTVETADLRQAFERFSGRSLERFFYDWTERPGHPELAIKTSYEADDRMVKVELTQKQKGEAFHFPLKIELVCPGGAAPVSIEKSVQEKELTLYVPVPARPKLVRIDPDFTLLADIQEEKSRDWWKQQVLQAPSIVERIRAVEHFGKSKTAADRKLLAEVLKNDPFYGVRIEAAAALGKSGGDISRDALISGLQQSEAKVRRACVDALAKFAADEKVEQALAARIKQGDASYGIEASLLTSLAKVQRSPSTQQLLDALNKDSHREVIRQAALKGLARSSDARALDVLLAWSRRGKPRECRTAAIRSLATYLTRNEVSRDRQTKSVEVVIELLRDRSRRVRQASIETLRDLGRTAEPARDVLESLAEHDPDSRVREAARAAVEKLKSDSPPSAELARLRKEVERLQKHSKQLEERLQKLEAK